DLGEHRLVLETERVVAPAVPRVGGQAAEVADTGNRNRQQAVEELPHPVAAQGDLGTDRLTLTELEAGDRGLRPSDDRLLPGDTGQVVDGLFQQRRLLGGVADA